MEPTYTGPGLEELTLTRFGLGMPPRPIYPSTKAELSDDGNLVPEVEVSQTATAKFQ